MGGIGSRIALGLAVGMAAFVACLGAAEALAPESGTVIASDPTCCTYLPGPYAQDQGQAAYFDNTASTTYHDVQAKGNGPDGKPLFSMTSLAPGGSILRVNGTEYLKPGSYPFYCTLHGAAMSGTLIINDAGTAVARPSVKVSIPAQKLRKVRKSGVKVKVKALTASKGVFLSAKKGKVTLGSKRGLSLNAGQSKTLTLRLTKAGRKAIKKGKSAKIKVSASVPFGKTSTASRKVK